MSEVPLSPATERDSIALGVIFRLSQRMTSGMPGASLSMTARVAEIGLRP